MIRVKNTSGRQVVETFFGYGTFSLAPGEVAEVPEDVWREWQKPHYWGGRECLLEEVPGETQDGEEEYKYVCAECGAGFNSSAKYAAHVSAHRRGKK